MGLGNLSDDIDVICKALDYLMSNQNKIKSRLH
jgi:hypothetical protein